MSNNFNLSLMSVRISNLDDKIVTKIGEMKAYYATLDKIDRDVEKIVHIANDIESLKINKSHNDYWTRVKKQKNDFKNYLTKEKDKVNIIIQDIINLKYRLDNNSNNIFANVDNIHQNLNRMQNKPVSYWKNWNKNKLKQMEQLMIDIKELKNKYDELKKITEKTYNSAIFMYDKLDYRELGKRFSPTKMQQETNEFISQYETKNISKMEYSLLSYEGESRIYMSEVDDLKKYKQYGGLFYDKYIKIYLNNIKYKWAIKFSKKQKFLFDKILDIKKYEKINKKYYDMLHKYKFFDNYIFKTYKYDYIRPLVKLKTDVSKNKNLHIFVEYNIKSILYYDHNPRSLLIIEIMHLHINKYNKNDEIFIISNHLAEYNAIKYIYKNKNINKYILTTYILEYYTYDKCIKQNTDNINYITSSLNLKNIANMIKNLNNYNLMFIDTFIFHNELKNIQEKQNNQLLISSLLLSFSILNKNGNLILVYPTIMTNLTSQLIYLTLTQYEETIIHLQELNNYVYFNSFILIIIFKNYKGYDEKFVKQFTKLVDNMYKHDPSGGMNYNVLGKENRKKFNVTREITKDTPKKYLTNIIDIIDKKEEKLFYDKIKEYNNRKLELLEQRYKEIEHYAENVESNPELEQQYRDYQLFHAKEYAHKYDLRIKPGFNQQAFSDYFGKKILQNMFSLDEGILFKFKKYVKDKSINIEPTKNELPDDFKKIYSNIELARSVIDTRDPKKYYQVSQITRMYRKSVSIILNDKYNIPYKYTTQAWLKMYELLETLQLFKLIGAKIELKTFHICEAPGAFISAMTHYLKTKTKIEIENYEWMAQSLNPFNKDNIKIYGDNIFGKKDELGMLKNNPERWNWGKDGTGDITNINNIKYYKKYCEKVQLITSDCGLYRSDDFSLNKLYDKINYSQFLFMLNNVPKNGNCIMKVFMPFNTQKISLIYIIYSRFKNVYFYKSMQNPGSEEFYLVAINYQNPLNNDELKIFYNLLKKYDTKTSLVDVDKIPLKFIYQLLKIYKKLANNYDEYIQKKIYYVDNIDNISVKHFKDLEKMIPEKSNDWIEEMNIVKSENNAYL